MRSRARSIHAAAFAAVFGAAALLATARGVAWAGPRAVLAEAAKRDAGEVEPGQLQRFQYTLRNDGDAALSIEALEPTCYCTSAKAEAWEIPAGGQTKIHVAVDPSDFVGPIRKGVEILTNDPRTPKLLVEIALVVRPGIAVVPPELDFGSVAATGSRTQQVDLKAPRERPFRVVSAAAEVPYLSVNQEALELEERSGTRLYVKVLPGAPPGPFATRLVVETDDAARPRIEVPVRGSGAGGLHVEPAKLVFEAAAPGTAIGTVALAGDAGLQVTAVRSTSPQVEASLTPAGAGRYTIQVKLAANAKPGRVLAKLVVATNDAAQHEVTIPVMGLAR